MNHLEHDSTQATKDALTSSALAFEPIEFPNTNAVRSSHLEQLQLPSSPSPFEAPSEFTDFTHHDLGDLPNRAESDPAPNSAAFDTPFLQAFAPLVKVFTPHSVAYSIAFKLLGDRSAATNIASKAAGLPSVVEAARTAVAESISAHKELTSTGVISPESVTHFSHRARVCRDLNRWSPKHRVFLSLRHLAGMNPSMVADHTGAEEVAVRAVTSAWVPEDAKESCGMLQDLDSWIGRNDTAASKVPEGATLDHLCDPAGLPSVANTI